VTCERKLARIEHVLIVKAYFERRKIAKVFMTHVQDTFGKSLLTATFERKLSSHGQLLYGRHADGNRKLPSPVYTIQPVIKQVVKPV